MFLCMDTRELKQLAFLLSGQQAEEALVIFEFRMTYL